MVIRLFRRRVKTEKLGSLDELLVEVTLPLLKNREGLVRYYIGKPMAPNANALGTISTKRTKRTVFTSLQTEIAKPLDMEDFRLDDTFYEG
jgi:hypothetical protein